MANTNGRGQVFDLLQNRILTHYEAAQKIRRGEMPRPRTAIVYPTYICNQRCKWCEYADDNEQIRAVMSDDQLRQLMWDLQNLGVQGVEFCGGGEPTLHPLLPELVREMHARGMSTGVLTNGTKLSGELATALVDCGSYVRVGFDSANAETYNRVKRPKSPEATFDSVCQNIANMLALRKARGTKIRISMKVVLSSENYTEVEGCVQLAIELGVDSIQFKAARLCDTELDTEQSAWVTQEMARLRDLYPRMPIVGGVDKLNMHKPCWLTPLQIMIDTLGDAFLCCYYRHRKDRHCFGNVFTDGLENVWYSERHWEAIRSIEPHECNLLDCRFVHYNRLMETFLVENEGQFEFI